MVDYPNIIVLEIMTETDILNLHLINISTFILTLLIKKIMAPNKFLLCGTCGKYNELKYNEFNEVCKLS